MKTLEPVYHCRECKNVVVVEDELVKCRDCDIMCVPEDCIILSDVVFVIKDVTTKVELKAAHEIVFKCFNVTLPNKVALAKQMLTVQVTYREVDGGTYVFDIFKSSVYKVFTLKVLYVFIFEMLL